MSSVKLEILTPRDKLFEGDVEYLQIDTVSGSEGFLPNHLWCRKLLKDEGKSAYRVVGETENRTFRFKGGFVEIRDRFTVYVEDAELD